MEFSPEIFAGGRVVPDAMDRVRRYCGRAWSGGPGMEVWAWQYYDMVPTSHDNWVSATDVMVAGALHPGISRADLEFFVRHDRRLSRWLDELDAEVSIYSADDATLAHLATAVDFEPNVSITLLSKVLHRKRPRLIPPLDRHVIDWYRPVTGERTPSTAWAPIVHAMRDDADPSQVLTAGIALSSIHSARRPARVGFESHEGLSVLRATDIAIWMGSR